MGIVATREVPGTAAPSIGGPALEHELETPAVEPAAFRRRSEVPTLTPRGPASVRLGTADAAYGLVDPDRGVSAGSVDVDREDRPAKKKCHTSLQEKPGWRCHCLLIGRVMYDEYASSTDPDAWVYGCSG